MADNKDIREHEKVVRKIEKTVESIRKKSHLEDRQDRRRYRDQESHFKPIIEPLQKIVDNFSMRAIKDEPRHNDVKTFAQKDMSKMKRKREDMSVDHALSGSHKLMRHTSNDMKDSPAIMSTLRTTIEAAKPIKDEDVFQITNDSFTTSVQYQTQTSEGRKALSQHLDPLGQEYIRDFLSGGEKNKTIDTVYGVRLDKDGIITFGNKKFDVVVIT